MMDKYEIEKINRALASLKKAGYTYKEALRLPYNELLKLERMGKKNVATLFGEPVMTADPKRVAEVTKYLTAIPKEM